MSFRFREGLGEDDCLRGHCPDPIRVENPAFRQPDENIGATYRFLESAFSAFRVRTGGKVDLERTHAGIVGTEYPRTVQQGYVTRPGLHEQAGYGQPRCPGAGDDDRNGLDLFPYDFQGVPEGGEQDDRRSVLVVAEDRDGHFFLEFPDDCERVRARNVLDIETAHARSQQSRRVDDVLGVTAVEADGQGVWCSCRTYHKTIWKVWMMHAIW